MHATTVNTPTLVTVPFHGDGIVTFQADDGPRVAMRRIVENVGLSWGSQRNRLMSQKAKFACVDINTRDSLGREQSMLTMPVARLPLWLATINPNKVRPDLRTKVELYQTESAVALHDYWTKGVAVRGDMDGLVTGLDPAAMRAIGGMFKGILHKALTEVVPLLVEAEIGSRQYGVVEGLTAGAVLEMAGVKNRKGLRGLPRRVSDRLRRYHAEKGKPVNIAKLGQSSAYVFDPAISREWLDGGGKASVERWIEQRRGQGTLKLVQS